MSAIVIKAIHTHDLRYELEEGAGADSVHSKPAILLRGHATQDKYV